VITRVPADGAALGPQDLVDLLSHGDLEVHGRLVDASNVTLYATTSLDGVQVRCVYKPVAGERPLWDFPSRTLARREVAAYHLSTATGWGVVPPTVFRQEGPFGAGSVQYWVADSETDSETSSDSGSSDSSGSVPAEPGAGLIDVLSPEDVPPGWLHVLQARTHDGDLVSLVHADDSALRRMAVFDVVTNNADRKGGHVLRDSTGELFGVDHGLTFNVENRLRTVLWGWAGQQLTDDVLEVLQSLASDLDTSGPLHRELRGLLAPAEIDRTGIRIRTLLRTRRHPWPDGSHHPIPWPPF
jgi:uncharacterized repeat protein (TIGR03843 family)